jgi:hypothetical protein
MERNINEFRELLRMMPPGSGFGCGSALGKAGMSKDSAAAIIIPLAASDPESPDTEYAQELMMGPEKTPTHQAILNMPITGPRLDAVVYVESLF